MVTLKGCTCVPQRMGVAALLLAETSGRAGNAVYGGWVRHRQDVHDVIPASTCALRSSTTCADGDGSVVPKVPPDNPSTT